MNDTYLDKKPLNDNNTFVFSRSRFNHFEKEFDVFKFSQIFNFINLNVRLGLYRFRNQR